MSDADKNEQQPGQPEETQKQDVKSHVGEGATPPQEHKETPKNTPSKEKKDAQPEAPQKAPTDEPAENNAPQTTPDETPQNEPADTPVAAQDVPEAPLESESPEHEKHFAVEGQHIEETIDEKLSEPDNADKSKKETVKAEFDKCVKKLFLPFGFEEPAYFSIGKYYIFIAKERRFIPQAEANNQIIAKQKEEDLSPPSPQPESEHFTKQRIFLVFGNRETMKNEVVALLHLYGIEPILLQEKKIAKHSLDELFIHFPNVKFAIVLLSGDNFVYDKESQKPGDAVLRARQDIVFHLGFLLAKLGKQNTFILYHEQKSFYLPVGLHQAIFTPFLKKNDSWKELLLSRLSTAGFHLSEQKSSFDSSNRCESCGAPSKKKDSDENDGEHTPNYCNECAPEGELLEFEEIKKKWIARVAKIENIAPEVAERKIDKLIKKMPAWGKNSF